MVFTSNGNRILSEGHGSLCNQSLRLFFFRLVPGGRARTWESVRGISGFPKHGYFPQRNPLCPLTLFRESLVSHGTNQDHQASKNSLTSMDLGRSKTFQDFLGTERVGVAFTPNTQSCQLFWASNGAQIGFPTTHPTTLSRLRLLQVGSPSAMTDLQNHPQGSTRSIKRPSPSTILNRFPVAAARDLAVL